MSGFSTHRYSQLAALEQTHFWFIARRQHVLSLLRKFCERKVRHFADIGCGTGYNLGFFTAFSHQVYGLDRLVEHSPHQVASPCHMACTELPQLPLLNESVEVCTLLDVLEHVDDRALLTETSRVLSQNGFMIITVPAFQWLWSERDVQAGHQRRYNKAQLIELVTEAGFKVKYINYYQFLLFPLVLITRLFSRKKRIHQHEEKPSPFINRICHTIASLELRLHCKGLYFPWGSSLVLVATKEP